MVWKLKKRLRLFKRIEIYLCIAIFMIFAKFSFGYFSETVKLYIDQKSRIYAMDIISDSINNDVLSNINDTQIVDKVYDNNKELMSASINTYQANLIRAYVAKSVNKSIESINEQDDFKYIMIPLGYFFSRNYFLANGIRVPINLEIIGSTKLDIKSDVKSYGINSSLVEINLEVAIKMQIMVPFQREQIDLVYNIPLAMEIINSDVPFVLSN